MKQTSHLSLEIDSSPVTRIVRIFEERKEQLRFPDIDADKLKALQAAVQKESEAVCELEEALAEAREALGLTQKALHEKAAKAHAYLQVFAAGDAEWEAELANIHWGNAERSGRKPRPTSKKRERAQARSEPTSAAQEARRAEPAAAE